MNDQRKVIFEHRIDIMGRDDVSDTVIDLRQQVVRELVAECIPPNAYAEQWNSAKLMEESARIFGVELPIDKWAAEEGIADEEITERLMKAVEEKAAAKEAEFGPETMRQIEKMVLLQTLDHLWREHLVTLEHLRQVIHFRGYGQRDPLNEYKSEGFHLFEAMLANLREAVTGQLMHIQGMPPEEEESPVMHPVDLPPMQAHHVDPFTGEDELAMADAALAAASRPMAREAERRAPVRSAVPRMSSIPRTPPRGARSRATRRVRAAQARSTSTATASTTDPCGCTGGRCPRIGLCLQPPLSDNLPCASRGRAHHFGDARGRPLVHNGRQSAMAGSGGYSIAVRPSPRRPGYRAEASDMREMVMVGFLQAQNCSNFAGSWRHPQLAQRLLLARL